MLLAQLGMQALQIDSPFEGGATTREDLANLDNGVESIGISIHSGK